MFVLLALTGMFGSRTDVVTRVANGYTLTVSFARVTRPGLPVRWEYQLGHAGGFSGPVAFTTTFDYLHLFDLTGIDPTPSGQSSTGDDIVWQFDQPASDTFRVTFDAAAESGLHEVPTAIVRVLIGGSPVVEASFETVVVP